MKFIRGNFHCKCCVVGFKQKCLCPDCGYLRTELLPEHMVRDVYASIGFDFYMTCDQCIVEFFRDKP